MSKIETFYANAEKDFQGEGLSRETDNMPTQVDEDYENGLRSSTEVYDSIFLAYLCKFSSRDTLIVISRNPSRRNDMVN